MFYKLFFFLFYNGYALCCIGNGREGGGQVGRSLSQFGQVLIIMVL